MKWPWVSRALYEREHQIAEWNWELACRYRSLLVRQTQAGKQFVQSIVEAATSSIDPAPVPPVQGIVAEVIREQAKGDPRLGAHLRSYASQLKREGKSLDDIAMALTQWSTTEPVGVI